MKSKMILNKIIFILVVIIELALCVLSCVKINNKKYDEWVETDATIIDVSIYNTIKSVRGREPTVISILVDYLDNNKRIMDFDNYHLGLHEGDTITIKYNPENQRDIIYLPYENKRLLLKRIKIIIFFGFVVFFTFCIYKKNDQWINFCLTKKHLCN